MAEGNGAAADMSLPPETVPFTLGGETLNVPALMFVDAEELRAPLTALGPGQEWIDYANSAIEIIVHQMRTSRPDLTQQAIKRRMKAGEGAAIGLRTSMNALLRASGFPIPETAPPAPADEVNLGIGTSTGSAPSLPSEASAEETPGS